MAHHMLGVQSPYGLGLYGMTNVFRLFEQIQSKYEEINDAFRAICCSLATENKLGLTCVE